jgi:tetratricopeptide (TPR) repeat protein
MRSSATVIRDLRLSIEQGRSQLRQGRPELAFQAVCDARDDEPGAGEAVSLAAAALIRMGELRAARLALERAIKLDPDQFESAVTLAELHVDLGNAHRGAEVFEMAVRLRPRDIRVWLALGRVLEDQAEYFRAMEAYQKVLELEPNSRNALIGFIRCRPAQAEPWVLRALQGYPNDPIILGLAARDAYEHGELDQALARAERALALDPGSAEALFARAQTRVARSQWELALPDAERASAAWPNDMQLLRFLLVVETHLDLKDRAAGTLDRCKEVQERIDLWDRLAEQVKGNPDDPRPLHQMGETALNGGARLLATRCFEAALALDPSYDPSRQSLNALRASQAQEIPALRAVESDRATSARPAVPFHK